MTPKKFHIICVLILLTVSGFILTDCLVLRGTNIPIWFAFIRAVADVGLLSLACGFIKIWGVYLDLKDYVKSN